MTLKSSLTIIFLISVVHGCEETDCRTFNTKLQWQRLHPDSFDKQPLTEPLRDRFIGKNVSKLLEKIRSKRMHDNLSSDLGFQSIRKNAELSRTLLQQIIQNVQRSQDFPQRFNRADSKENYHLQASYIPRLG